MPQSDEQARHERLIFERFALRAGIPFEPGSIVSQRPPRPDIVYTTPSGEGREFELVEILDEGVAQSTSDQIRLQSLLESTWGEPKSTPAADDLANALVCVWFESSARLRDKLAAVPMICEVLRQRDPVNEDDLAVPLGAPATAVKRVFVLRGEFNGPCFDVGAGGSYSDPLVTRLLAKCDKSYEATGAIELLAFYELQSPPPSDILEARLELVRDLASKQRTFLRIWIFDASRGRILLVIPEHPRCEPR